MKQTRIKIKYEHEYGGNTRIGHGFIETSTCRFARSVIVPGYREASSGEQVCACCWEPELICLFSDYNMAERLRKRLTDVTAYRLLVYESNYLPISWMDLDDD